jgi:hypothetical protein
MVGRTTEFGHTFPTTKYRRIERIAQVSRKRKASGYRAKILGDSVQIAGEERG